MIKKKVRRKLEKPPISEIRELKVTNCTCSIFIELLSWSVLGYDEVSL